MLETKKKWTKKIHPGVSTFGETPELVGPEHLEGLIEHALDIIDEDDVPDTPIFLLATAGMRLLPEHQRNAVLRNICSYMQRNTKFQLPDCDLHVQVIPGETEGLYGWIAANYLLGGFDADAPTTHSHGKGHHTYGFLDMGGASAQIAFAPNATEADKHADDLKLLRLRTIDGKPMEYRVFVTTWLGYGVNEARKRYVEALMEASPGSLELPDPCLPAGLTVMASGAVIQPGSDVAVGKEPHLLGTGLFTECLRRTFPLLDKDAPCADPPCLLHGVHVPAIDFDVNHFVGVSEYWHTTHSIFSMGDKDQVAYDFHTYQQRVTEFCSQDWASIEEGVAEQKWGKQVDEGATVDVCFKASWLINMLHDGIGIPRVGLESTSPPKDGHFVNGTKELIDGAKKKGFLDPFQAVDKIDGKEVSWTLGKMLLYASSQVPPADDTLAVGFGSNVPGIAVPKDFQYAGGSYVPLPGDLGDADNSLNEGTDWHDTLFTSGSSRRVPGLILFMLIVFVAAFLLCGRERRGTIYYRLLTLVGMKPSRRRGPKGGAGGLSSKIFGTGSRGPSYERVELGDPAEFELGEVLAGSDSDSDHSGTHRPGSIRSVSTQVGTGGNGKTSGWATPKPGSHGPGFASPALSLSSPKRARGYFDSVNNVLSPPNMPLTPGATGGGGFGLPSSASATALSLAAAVAEREGDRDGIAVRTESRERLVAPGPLLRSASRNGSRAPSPRRSAGGFVGSGSGIIKENLD